VALSISGPWLIVGNFNLIRNPVDKNNGNFDVNLSSTFNDAIRSLALFELPQLDHLYTWSNKRDALILTRLDRAFFNQAWGVGFP
jgi:hypothetical protein